jgi:hypothetical protein
VAQMATLLILEPIFEADFEDCSYRFRPNRSAHQALEETVGHIRAGYQAVYDADLKGYFESIPHDTGKVEPLREGDATSGSDFSPASQPVPALVR